ncbi:MAG: pilus assembly protein PilP [Pseudomonadales bacterium]|jgi:type IV pilus assembly protein PilO|nr:pilus assembly protein PilP [Pseudomonadales bacterium]
MTLSLWYGELRRFDWHDLFDLDTIGHWPAPLRVLVLALLFGLGVGVGQALLLRGVRLELEQSIKKSATLQSDLQTKTALAATLGAERARLQEEEAAFALYQSQLSTRAAIPALLDVLAKAAWQSGLTLDELKLRQEIPHDFYVEQPFYAVLRGDYHALGAFADAVAALTPLVTAGDFSIDPAPEAPALRMTLNASAYRAVVEDSVATAPALPPLTRDPLYRAAALRNPFALPSITVDVVRATEALEAFALAQLSLVGTLEGKGQRWALIRDASGKVARVGLGARLGRDQGRIVRITRERVDLIEQVSTGAGWRERENSLLLPKALRIWNEEQKTQGDQR